MAKAKTKTVAKKMPVKPKVPFGSDRWIVTQARYLRMLAHFMSKEETRYYLQGIHVEPAPKGIFLVATDGHRMGVIHDESGVCGKTFINTISPLSLSAAKQMARGKKAVPVFAAFAGERLHLIKNVDDAKALARKDVELSADYSERLPVIDGTYPQWKRVIEDTQKAVQEASIGFAFNPRYIADFGKVYTDAGFPGYSAMTFFQTQGESGPMFVRIGSVPEFLGVQMPMRRSGGNALPDWLSIPPAPTKALPKKKAA